MGHGLIKREHVRAKIEVTYGTDPTPAAADSILIRNITHAPDRLRMVRRGAIRSSLGELQQIYGGMLQGISFECEVKGSGSLGVAPEVGVLLRACGLIETINAGVSVVYTPRSTGVESCTLHYFEAGDGSTSSVRHILVGSRGNVEFMYEAGDILLGRFNFVGKRTANPTDQVATAPTYDTTVPVAIKGMASTIGGVTTVVAGYTLNLNNEIVIPPNLNDVEGFGEVTIGARDPTLELRRHNELVATIAPWADMTAGTVRAFASGNLGPAANRVTLAAALGVHRNVTQGEADGMRTNTTLFGLAESATFNDDFTLTFA